LPPSQAKRRHSPGSQPSRLPSTLSCRIYFGIFPSRSAGVSPVPLVGGVSNPETNPVEGFAPQPSEAQALTRIATIPPAEYLVMPNLFRHLPHQDRNRPACSFGRRGFQPRNKPRRGVCPPSQAKRRHSPGSQPSRLPHCLPVMLNLFQHLPHQDRNHPACRVPCHAEFISASSPTGSQPSRLFLW
jgi:hypothetical protein